MACQVVALGSKLELGSSLSSSSGDISGIKGKSVVVLGAEINIIWAGWYREAASSAMYLFVHWA